jgi:hypothetical protein
MAKQQDAGGDGPMARTTASAVLFVDNSIGVAAMAESSTVKPGNMGAIAVPPTLQHNHRQCPSSSKYRCKSRRSLCLVTADNKIKKYSLARNKVKTATRSAYTYKISTILP